MAGIEEDDFEVISRPNASEPPDDGFEVVSRPEPPRGQVERGNIDLHSRPVVNNDDGTISTVRSISVGFDDGTYLLPTVSPDGKVLSDKDAIELFKKSGQHLGKFKSSGEADAYGKTLSAEQAKEYDDGFEIVDRPASAEDKARLMDFGGVDMGTESLRQQKREFEQPAPGERLDPETIAQNILEFAKGTPKGIGGLVGGGMKGVAASQDLNDFADKNEMSPDFGAAYQTKKMAEPKPARGRVVDDPLYKLGDTVQQGSDILPAAKGYEDSTGRQLGEGFGSVIAGAGLSLVGGSAFAGAAFMAAGSGEAVDRAIEFGATEDQIIAAAAGGVIPGLTDSLPIETLLGRIPIPGAKIAARLIPNDMLGSAIKVAGRLGWQTTFEGLQEGGQKWLQNIVAKLVYNPDQDLTEGVLPEAGLGAGVGFISETARLAMSAAARRKGGGDTLNVDPTKVDEYIINREQQTSGDYYPPGDSRNGPAAITVAPTPQDGGPPEIPVGVTATGAPLPVTINQGDIDSPLDTGQIARGKEIMAEGQADKAKGDILTANQWPGLGERVTLDRGKGPEAGAIGDAFSTSIPETGAKADGLRIDLDDGTRFEAFADELRRAGVRITPEQAAAAAGAVVPPSATGGLLDEPLTNPPVATQPQLGKTDSATTILPQDQPAPAPAPTGDGSRAAPIDVAHPDHVDQAAARANTEATDAQKEAGNYAKGHIRLQGLDITIETAKGEERSGVGANGERWSVPMPSHYGYIKRTNGADGEQVDVSVGPNPESKTVWVIDQKDADTGAFDEHKVKAGFLTKDAAIEDYRLSFSDGKADARMGAVTEMSLEDFRKNLDEGDYTKPIAGQVSASPAGGTVAKPDYAPAPSSNPKAGDAMSQEDGRMLVGYNVYGGVPDNSAIAARVQAMLDSRRFELAGDIDILTNARAWASANPDTMASLTKKPAAAPAPVADTSSYQKIGDAWTKRITEASGAAPGPKAIEKFKENLRLAVEEGKFTDSFRPDNKQSRAMFEEYTGTKLPAGLRATQEFIEQGAPFQAAGPATKADRPASKPGQTIEEQNAATATRPNPNVVAPTGDRAAFRLIINKSNLVVHDGMTYNVQRDTLRNTWVLRTQPTSNVPGSSPKVTMARPEEGEKWSEGAARQRAFEIAFPDAAEDAAPAPAPIENGEKSTDSDMPKKAYGASNTMFTQEERAAAAARIRNRLKNQSNVGLDPDMLADGIKVAGFHIEAGARSFIAFAKAMTEELGEGVRPYLKSWYSAIYEWPGIDGEGMTHPARITPEMVAEAGKEDSDGIQGSVSDSDEGAGSRDVQRAPQEREDGRASDREGDAGQDDVSRPDQQDGEAAERLPPGRAGGKRGGAASAGNADRLPAADRADAGVTGQNYIIEPGALQEARSFRQKARDNIRAIELMRAIEAEARPATKAEQEQLAMYVGWGGIKGAFPDSDGKFSQGFEEIGEKLKTLLNPTEYKTARRTIQYAHYTAETIVREMWRAAERLGFTGGLVFEPGMGVGNFAGMMPPDLAAATQYSGLELDPTTARIARLLYPQSGVRQDDFTKAPLPRDTYDLVIGNPPFGDIPIKTDPAYKQGFLIHDYFFAKSLDAVRPGGILAFVTSAGTLNKLDTKAREYFAERAEFVGAIRLPGDAFAENAGTQVTTDIIFLRKLLPGESAANASWTETGEVTLPNKDGAKQAGNMSRYFIDNPDMVLGEQGFFDKLTPGRYGVRADGRDFASALAAAVEKLPASVMRPWEYGADRDGPGADFGSKEKKEGSFYLKDGNLMQQRSGVGKPVAKRGAGVEGGKTTGEVQRIKKLVPIRDALRAVYDADLRSDVDAGLAARKTLNAAYDAFVELYGPINKAEFQFRHPTIIQQEGARLEAREEARFNGTAFDDGEFNVEPMLRAKAKIGEIAQARQAAREAAVKEGRQFDEGTFNPDDMADVVIDRRPNVGAFMDDPESYRLRSIEKYDEIADKAEKGRVFFENIISKELVPEIKGVGDALLYVLNQKGRLDIAAVAQAAGLSEPEAIEQLGEQIFQIPGTQNTWATAEHYLSGNVRQKLREAQAAAESNPALARNVESLKAIQPAPLPPSEIAASLGMPWIPTDVVEAFAKDGLGLERAKVSYLPALAQWSVTGDSSSVASTSTWGTSDRSADKLLLDALNRQDPKIYDTIRVDGKNKQVLNPAATQAVQDKVREIKAKFQDWVYTDEARTDRLVTLYNENYNNLVVPNYNGDYLTTPGIATGWKWRPHQTRVIARIIQGGNTYMAHAVGAGKTSAMIATGMEMRRLGLVRKPMYAVPNHMLGQFTKEFYEQYPTAKIMVADEKRFHTDTRKQFISDVANEDLDAVIITHSAFGKIPVSAAFQDNLIQEQLDQYRDLLAELGKDPDNRITRGKIEAAIEKLEQRLGGKAQKQDQTFTFEEMGIDHLFIDEAHLFRKLDFATKMSNVKGISSEGSKMSWDLYVKTRYLETKNPGHSLVLASGTPITNTMAELYTVSRYLQPKELEARGLGHFDAWAAAYGDTAAELEQNAAGGYKPVTRFAKFVNIPELSAMVRLNMDVVTSKQLEQYVTRPAIEGGIRKLIVVEKSESLEEFQQTLAARMTAIEKRKGPPKKGDDIMLTVINDGRHAAIDMRLVHSQMRSDPGSKLNSLVDGLFEEWEQTKNQPFYKPKPTPGAGYEDQPFMHGPATQMVFANLGIGDGRPFNVQKYIVSEMVRRGVPRDQIAIISDFKSHTARQRLFNDMNDGKVRILIGSTAKMATGVNAQRRLSAIHNLDPLWYPADDEQRIGRGLRQGNTNRLLKIRDYSTKGTYDSTMWGMMERKARFIQGFFEGDPSVRDMEDLGEASQYEQAKAITTNDPRLITLTEHKQDLEKERRRQSGFEREQYALRSKVANAKDEVARVGRRLAAIEKDIAIVQDTSGDLFTATLGEETFDERKAFGEALIKRLEELVKAGIEQKQMKIAKLGGFDLAAKIYKDRTGKELFYGLDLLRSDKYSNDLPVSNSPLGIVRSVETILRNLPGSKVQAEGAIADAQQEIEAFTPKLGAKFGGGERIRDLAEKVAAIEAQFASEAAAAKATMEAQAPEEEGDDAPRTPLASKFGADQTETPKASLLGDVARKSDAEALEKVKAILLEEFRKLGLDDKLALTIHRELRDSTGDSVNGLYWPGGGLIEIALRGDPRRTLKHEAIHALRDLGLFRPAEWAALERAARANTKLWNEAKAAYAGNNLTEEQLVEEVIAEMFARWKAADPAPTMFKRAMAKIEAFFRALREAVTQSGYTNAEELMQAVSRGEVGRRGGPIEWIDAPGPMGIAPELMAAGTDESSDFASDSDPERTGAVAPDGTTTQNLLRTADKDQVLDHIEKFSTDPERRNLARILKQTIADNIVYRHMRPSEMRNEYTGNYRGGFYDHERSLFTVHADMATDPERAFLHEGVHAATVSAINRRTPTGKAIDRLFDAYQDLAGKYTWKDTGDQYGFRNSKEFVAEVLTKPRFREILDQIKAEGQQEKSLLQKFYDILRNLFGLKPTDPLGYILKNEADVLDPKKVLGGAARETLFWGGPKKKDRRPYEPQLDSRSVRAKASKLGDNRAVDLVKFANKESEDRFKEARKGVGNGPGFIAEKKELWETLATGFSRHYRFLPNTKEFSDVHQQLRKLEAAPHAAIGDIVRHLENLVGDFNDAEMDLFTRKVVLDDLSWEVTQEHDLPFGLSDMDVPAALAKVDAALAKRPDIMDRVRQRKLMMMDIADKMVAAGVLKAEQIKNPAYYRHQVLDYARAMVRLAPDSKLKKPRWAKREGSTKDINANLLEAEFDWLHKALVDIETAKVLTWIDKSNLNIRADVLASAKAHNKAIMDRILADDMRDNGYSTSTGRNTSPVNEVMVGFSKKIAQGFKEVRAAIDNGYLDDIPAEFERAARALSAETSDADVFPFLAWIADNDKDGAMGAMMAFKAISGRRQFVKQMIGEARYADTSDVKSLLAKGFGKEGYVTWQPDEGKLLYTQKTLPQQAIDKMLRKMAESSDKEIAEVLGLSTEAEAKEFLKKMADEIRAMAKDALVMAGDKYQMVIPEELAVTLNKFRDPVQDDLANQILTRPIQLWKQWTLISPRRVIKYNLNNLTGDLDAVIAGNPRIVRRLPQAIGELYSVMKGGSPSARYREAVARGVFDAGITVQEIPDINSLSQFENLFNKTDANPLRRWTLAPIGKVWRALQDYTQFRENWMRYAAYLDYVERLEGGESMQKIGYGASKIELVDGVADLKDKAALLARDLVGDYGGISAYGQGIRRKVVPFYSWWEVNFKRYIRLSANAYHQGIGQGLSQTGRVGAVVGIKGAVLGVNATAYLASRMFYMYLGIQLFNWLFHDDEEEKLDPAQRAQLHLTLGTVNGQVVTLRTQGALSDFLSWFGLQDAVATFGEIAKGRAGWTDVLLAMAKAPINKLASGVGPHFTEPFVLASGKKFWPDIFNPRAVRDNWREFFSVFGVEHEYDALAGKPSRGYARSWINAAVYTADPGEQAYNRIVGMSHDWENREKGTSGGAGSFSSPRSQALYDWRRALRFGDEAAAKAALARTVELGVKPRDRQRSLKSMHPLGNLTTGENGGPNERARFKATLSTAEKSLLDDAEKWYRDEFLGNARASAGR